MVIKHNSKEHTIITYATSIRSKLTRISHLKEGLKDIQDIEGLKLIESKLKILLSEVGVK